MNWKNPVATIVALVSLSLTAQPALSVGNSSLVDKRQQALARAINATAPKNRSTLLTSVSNLGTKVIDKDPVLKGCIRHDCTLNLGNVRRSDNPPLVYMFGDSHVEMWIPAVYSALKSKKIILRVKWTPGCPAAQISLWGINNGAQYGVKCDAWREQSMAKVLAAKPDYVILAERTSTLLTGANQPLDGPTLSAGLQQTIRYFQSGGAKVIIVGDTPPFENWLNPGSCVVVNLTALKRCQTTVTSTSPYFQSFGSAEALAARATAANFIDPTWWLCEKKSLRCPAVVDDKVIYIDSSHISLEASYGLSDLMGAALLPVLKLLK